MNVAIIGANGMLSMALTKFFYAQPDTVVDVYGLDASKGYECTNFYQTNLLKYKLDYDKLVKTDVIVYASGRCSGCAQN